MGDSSTLQLPAHSTSQQPASLLHLCQKGVRAPGKSVQACGSLLGSMGLLGLSLSVYQRGGPAWTRRPVIKPRCRHGAQHLQRSESSSALPLYFYRHTPAADSKVG